MEDSAGEGRTLDATRGLFFSSSESTPVQDALVLSPPISPSCAQHTMNVPPGGVYVPCIHSHAR